MGTLIHTRDYNFMNCIVKEVNRLAGCYCYYYVLNKVSSTRDDLYDEFTEEVFDYEPDGVQLECFAVNPEHALTTGEEGRRTQWDGEIWVSREVWEEAMPAGSKPKAGDVVNIWGEFFDVVDYDRENIVNDQKPMYLSWKMSLRRTTKFEPQRRVNTEE